VNSLQLSGFARRGSDRQSTAEGVPLSNSLPSGVGYFLQSGPDKKKEPLLRQKHPRSRRIIGGAGSRGAKQCEACLRPVAGGEYVPA
jgi:hypothetical protein